MGRFHYIAKYHLLIKNRILLPFHRKPQVRQTSGFILTCIRPGSLVSLEIFFFVCVCVRGPNCKGLFLFLGFKLGLVLL